MANYIHAEILCEAYTHLDIDIFDDKEALAELKNKLLPFFSERAKFLLGNDVEVKIEFEEGSLKTRLMVIGSAGAILLSNLSAGMSAYGSFRQGVEQLSKDSTTLAQSANLEVLFRTKTAYCDRVRVEKRKGVFGRVDELLSQLDGIKIDLSGEKLPTNEKALGTIDKAITNLVGWNDKAGNLFEKLDSDVTKGCISAGLAEELEKLPETLAWVVELETRSFRMQVANSDPAFAGKIASTAARYKATIAAIRRQMLARVNDHAPAKV